MKTLGKIINVIEEFLYKIFVVFSKGFFFYFSLIAGLLYKIIPLPIFKTSKTFFTKKQEDAVAFLLLVIVFLFGVNMYIRFYDGNTVARVSSSTINERLIESEVGRLDETELNLYKRYAKLDINSVSIKELRKTNEQIAVWLTVDGTNINYPIVKGSDNSFYLNHDINGSMKMSGWTFMDYRNSIDMTDDNTVFYGHNLANKTAFGSLINVFKQEWVQNSNHYIVILSEKEKLVYEVFSVYTIDPEIYYLQTNFEEDSDFGIFVNTLKSRSKFDFNVEVGKNDKIITLSTCTDDNKNRNVVHAKLIKE